ncbi:alpha/beta fold hydrolase [Pseudonocardia eucalypti]|uniref:Alpha/beta fold hydrolase n=1 Tax=Pseudonocardia eucalypti TaxID=648755 RepID=A0ABP9PYQ4_9PSEU|nr:alpha-beta hydrolase superfamily lysophospholipase [Pseudonocardia eucalypti]
MSERHLTVRTRDGLKLAGTLLTPDAAAERAVILVHGGGVTREEGGFFARLALGLQAAGVASLRFDLRGHGESPGRQEDLTLAGILSDITAALGVIQAETNVPKVSLLGASFSGGICGFYAAEHPGTLASLVLINPLLNYKKRFIDDKPYWHNEVIDEEAGEKLAANGFIPHSPTFKLGRPLLNEVFFLRPDRALPQIVTPTLLIHGSRDTFISIESSRAASTQFGGETKLIEIDGAQHGIAVHDDPTYADPQTQKWQAFAIESIAGWVTSH